MLNNKHIFRTSSRIYIEPHCFSVWGNSPVWFSNKNKNDLETFWNIFILRRNKFAIRMYMYIWWLAIRIYICFYIYIYIHTNWSCRRLSCMCFMVSCLLWRPSPVPVRTKCARHEIRSVVIRKQGVFERNSSRNIRKELFRNVVELSVSSLC